MFDEIAIESIKASLNAVPAGMKMLLNTGKIYQPSLAAYTLDES